MEETYRVAKPGSKIVLCDEGLVPGRKTWTGRRILKHDKRGLYSMQPPRELVPDNTKDVKVYWVWNGFY
jgi:hypothetical protein